MASTAIGPFDREPFELSGGKLWLRVEQRADVSRALPAYRSIATDIEARNAALAPPALHLSNGCTQRNAATLADCSEITRALSSSGVPAVSPLIRMIGLDQTGMRGQPPQLSLLLMMSRHLVPLT